MPTYTTANPRATPNTAPAASVNQEAGMNSSVPRHETSTYTSIPARWWCSAHSSRRNTCRSRRKMSSNRSRAIRSTGRASNLARSAVSRPDHAVFSRVRREQPLACFSSCAAWLGCTMGTTSAIFRLLLQLPCSMHQWEPNGGIEIFTLVRFGTTEAQQRWANDEAAAFWGTSGVVSKRASRRLPQV